jgi:hypothetical protein
MHQRNDYGAVYFDDPRVYLHMDAEMRIALSADELNAGQFIGQGLEALEEIQTNAAYVARLERWREFFLETEGCAFCDGWRICLGRFASVPGAAPGCRNFAVDFMDTLEMVGEKKPASVSIWQP